MGFSCTVRNSRLCLERAKSAHEYADIVRSGLLRLGLIVFFQFVVRCCTPGQWQNGSDPMIDPGR